MRLPPIPPEHLDADQRAFHEGAAAMIERRQFDRHFTTKDENGALLGPWSVWVRHPAIGAGAGAMSKAIADLDALPPRVREIVIITVGARYHAAYELYAHCAMARVVGLSDRQIAALCAGHRPEGLADEEALAFDCVSALAKGASLPGFLYAEAAKTFGANGLAQIVHLAGFYAYVSILLNAYDVPAPEDVAVAS